MPATQQSIEESGVPVGDLRPWHEIVKKGDEARVRAALQNLGRKRPYPKDEPRSFRLRRCPQHINKQQSDDRQEDDEDVERDEDEADGATEDDHRSSSDLADDEYTVKRTFIHIHPQELSPHTQKTWP